MEGRQISLAPGVMQQRAPVNRQRKSLTHAQIVEGRHTPVGNEIGQIERRNRAVVRTLEAAQIIRWGDRRCNHITDTSFVITDRLSSVSVQREVDMLDDRLFAPEDRHC